MFRSKVIYTGLIVLFISGLLADCRAEVPAATETPVIGSNAQLTPFWTATPSLRPVISPIPLTPSPFPSPTPTQIIYTVKKDDLMGGIAYHFGITVAELMTANPKVNPNMMGAGMQLIIPPAHPTPDASQTTPTLLPLQVELPPSCYPTAQQGLWCLLEVHNPLAGGITSITVQITLADASASAQTIQSLTAPLNLLPGGKTMLISAYFPPPLPQPYLSSAKLVSALPQPDPDLRNFPLEVGQPQLQIDPSGNTAQVKTSLRLPAGSPPAQTIWVLAMAYDVNGNPAGVRKVEIARSLAANEDLAVELTVYSLGPAIQKVELLAEAHP